MKIIAEKGERVVIVVPSSLGPGAHIDIVDDNGARIVEVITQDGLIGGVFEWVIRRDGTDNTGRR